MANRSISKNKSQKYGLKALTEEEFVEVEAAVKLLMNSATQLNSRGFQISTAELTSKQSKSKKV
jgi:hypothetical protein